MNRSQTSIAREWQVELDTGITSSDVDKFCKIDSSTGNFRLAIAGDQADFMIKQVYGRDNAVATVYAPGMVVRVSYEGADPTLVNGRAYLKVGTDLTKVIEEATSPPEAISKVVTYLNTTDKVLEFIL